MSYLDASVRERPDLAAQPLLSALPTSLRHVGLVDRLSLRVGLWLLVHGAAHAQTSPDRALAADRLRRTRERSAREFTQEQAWRLSLR